MRRSRLQGCLGCGCGVPIVAVALLACIYSFNNRPPEIIIPTHSVPVDNAYDDFVKAGRLLKAIPHKPPAELRTPPAESQMLAISRACSQDAAPGLAILRRALNKPAVAPPARAAGDQSFSSLTLFTEARVL